MAAIGDKVYYRKDGQNWKGDISRVAADGTVDINLHGSMQPHPTTGQLVEHPSIPEDGHAMNVGGVSGAKLASTNTDKDTDGHWWPRDGRFIHNAQGRREWQAGG